MEERERKMYDFTCSSCGDVDQVPFEPDRELRCKECMRAEREIRQRKAPRRKHNTRVSMPINCAECGKREVLDSIPKGKKLDELLCSSCAQEALGKKSTWNEVRRQKQHEARTTWTKSCDECGKKIILMMKPWPEREYYCNDCEHDHERGDKDALTDTEQVAHGVHKR